MRTKQKPEVHDDTWIPTQCGRCFANCAIRVHRINGVAVKIEGDPDSWQGSQGGLCAKGVSGLQVLYDPNRLNVPLRRTNPEEGSVCGPQMERDFVGRGAQRNNRKTEKGSERRSKKDPIADLHCTDPDITGLEKVCWRPPGYP